ncbi:MULTISPECIES: hypothetical protein [unclassified Mesorhizobium]|uniref:hypothetical protein n=1 Tax=unclassified Mesorhizobium TaxID=325217 RepID=UPI001093676F|nr:MULTISPECIES: hypothetical protein [unclassified Mesorhizobium]TGT91722.1 hypothetical protein EN804_01215 [Mesorhizobium sp. M8A.F.Ca.ET.161.01.1.1]TGV44748.1 hypothetical protein EN785_01210 [Mesorhizobium sp. M8A.F.Ca.ET.142.01.1.1]
MDLPSLILPEGRLTPNADLLARMLASEKTKEMIADAGNTAVKAVTDLKPFLRARKTSPRMRLLSAIINFYQEAKQGDYIIVPSSLTSRRVYLGKFVSDDVVPEFFKYGEHPIPSRTINWIANIDEGKISAPLSTSLRHQHAFSLVERSRFIEVFAITNGSYKYGDRTVATIYNKQDDFLDADSALIGIISKLSASACAAMQNREKMGDTLASLVSSVPIEFTCSQESDIHSEGFTRFISSALTPLVIAAVLACLLTADVNGGQVNIHNELKSIQIVNSLSPDDPCVPHVSMATKMILKSIDIQTTYELCKAAHAAKDRAGLEPTAKGASKP